MTDKDLGDGPSLELPSLFGRRKKGKAQAETPTPSSDAPAQETPADTAPAEPSAAEHGPPDDRDAVAPRPPVAEPTTELVAEPTAELLAEPVTTPADAAADAAGKRKAKKDEKEAAHATPDPVGTSPKPAKAPKPAKREAFRAPRQPVLAPDLAAPLTGALVGLLGVALTWLGMRGCEALSGTDSCGGPGLLVLLAIVIVMILAGAALLRALGLQDPGSLSFLGVGITCVVVLVFLLEHLATWWALVSVPAVTAAAYTISAWVTTRFVDEDL